MATAKKAEIYRWRAEQCWELAKAEKDYLGRKSCWNSRKNSIKRRSNWLEKKGQLLNDQHMTWPRQLESGQLLGLVGPLGTSKTTLDRVVFSI